MKILGLIIYVLAALVIAVLAFGFFMWYGSARSCQANDLVAAVSPNTHREAKIAIKKCANRNSPVIALIITDKSDPQWEQVTDMGSATTTDFNLMWLNDNTLQLIYPSTFALTKRPLSKQGIEIQLATKRGLARAR